MKQFTKAWIEGIKNSTPTQQLRAKLIGHYGSIGGIIFASIYLVYYGFWYLIFIMLFTIVLQAVEVIGTRQRYIQAKKIEDALKAQGVKNGI